MAGLAEEPSGQRRDIVVIGASAGGVDALIQIARRLPADLGAAVFVALHLPEGSTSSLPRILERAGPLPAEQAVASRPIEPGKITIAPPDHHLVLDAGRALAMRGPKINGHRPAVDVLFHSAARTYGARVVGVILSGALYDGTLGLRAIKRRGGLAVVQADARHESMPTSAIENVEVDAVLASHEIADALATFVDSKGGDVTPDQPIPDSDLEAGFDISELRRAPPGAPSVFRCPECGGSLWELEDGEVTGYACHVGHTFSADSMLEANDDAVERALWTAVRMLEEKAELLSRLAKRMHEGGNRRSSERFASRAREAGRQAALVRSAAESGEATEEAAAR